MAFTLCEDLHTSYYKYFGGGYKKSRSFIEYTKNFIDKIARLAQNQKITD